MKKTQEFEEELPSKSQLKREMLALREMGARLVKLTDEQIAPLMDPKILGAIQDCRRITKGNARKRQIAYIGKLLKTTNLDDLRNLIDRYDASSKHHLRQFHQIENWREQLIEGDFTALDEISVEYPNLDRQVLKQLARKASQERAIQENQQDPGAPIHFRKLFKYLKSLTDSKPMTSDP